MLGIGAKLLLAEFKSNPDSDSDPNLWDEDEENNDGRGKELFDVRADRRIFDNATARARPTAGVAWDARVDVTI